MRKSFPNNSLGSQTHFHIRRLWLKWISHLISICEYLINTQLQFRHLVLFSFISATLRNLTSFNKFPIKVQNTRAPHQFLNHNCYRTVPRTGEWRISNTIRYTVASASYLVLSVLLQWKWMETILGRCYLINFIIIIIVYFFSWKLIQ